MTIHRRGSRVLLSLALVAVAAAATNPVRAAADTPPRPTVTAVSPATGPASGGASVVISGTDFSGNAFSATSVQVGATTVIPCSSPRTAPCFTVDSPTSITLLTPPMSGNSGIVDITVTTPGGTSPTGPADRYGYTAPPPPTGGAPGAPLTAVNDTNTWVLPPAGTSSSRAKRVASTGPSEWSSTPFYGSVTTLAGALTPVGHSSLVAVNKSGVWVMTPNNAQTGFNSPALWSPYAFYGSRATLLADVNGDGLDELVAVNDDSVWVMSSNGTDGFSPPVRWSAGAFYGALGTMAADITGDGCADLVAVNGTNVWVMKANGVGQIGFGAPFLGSSSTFYGSHATLLANVSGHSKGDADLVAVDDNSQWVMTIDGQGHFEPPVQWSGTAFYGSRATIAADVTGSGVADLIAINDGNVYAMHPGTASFGAPAPYFGSPFFGSRATLPG
ncbi:MAG: VCBS repeat-containing protein [Candidatus Dormibacteraeota bacterium]|uniref:VCBS repeat-containing protein n=1 Tax=Candidatus Amunia macphersoniae TaxID=3127014 RepID=A0A934NJ62_9BACT|nr:VCBS repeat-containing protein [Candidatus Dormibacteraeota bacterium]